MSDGLGLFIMMHIAASAAVVLVLLLRLPVRRLFGVRVAYRLWLLVPLAGAVMLAPGRVVTITQAAPAAAAPGAATSALPAVAASALPSFDAAPWLQALWFAGLVASAVWLARSQARFGRAMQAGRAGPAAVGVLKPRVVLPADFERRYTPRERQMIVAHEATHIARQDPRINAVVAAARCAAWFNPLAHLAARCLRIDQELACDAAVLAAHPAARRSYAEAMLKTQLAARPLPLGCYWPAEGAHPLAQRIGLLSRALPGRRRRLAGGVAVSLLAVGWAGFVWAARPADIVVRTLPAPPLAVVPVSTAAVTGPAPRRVSAPTPRPTPTAAPAPAADPAPEVEEAAPPPLVPVSYGPGRDYRIHAAAQRSSVEPGYAVRLVATMHDAEGRELITDLTALGSQDDYRIGYFERNGSRSQLFTAVEQQGDLIKVTVSLGPRFAPWSTASTTLASGQTGVITLDSGEAVTVTPTLRSETAEEAQDGRLWAEQRDRVRLVRTAFEPRLLRCGRPGAIC